MLVKILKPYPTTPKAYINLNAGNKAIIDPCWKFALDTLSWYAKQSACCIYACSKVKVPGGFKFLRMHRVIANTPKEMLCHHINGDPLDNRRSNLRNVTMYEHAKLYSYR